MDTKSTRSQTEQYGAAREGNPEDPAELTPHHLLDLSSVSLNKLRDLPADGHLARAMGRLVVEVTQGDTVSKFDSAL